MATFSGVLLKFFTPQKCTRRHRNSLKNTSRGENGGVQLDTI